MAKEQIALSVKDVSMKFNLSSEKVDNIKEYVIKMLKKELMYQEFWALRDVTFEVKKGDRVGVFHYPFQPYQAVGRGHVCCCASYFPAQGEGHP